MKWFNPKIKDFMEENKDQGIIGLAWSLYWRLSIAIALIYMGIIGALYVLIAILD